MANDKICSEFQLRPHFYTKIERHRDPQYEVLLVKMLSLCNQRHTQVQHVILSISPQSNGCVRGPGFIHLLTENASGDGLALASNTIRTFVLVALSLMTVCVACRKFYSLLAVLELLLLFPCQVAL